MARRYVAPTLGDALARQFRLVEARATQDAWTSQLEETAKTLGADLSDPDDFRVIDDIVRGR